MIKDVLLGMLENFMIAYTDDILIYSTNLDIHITHIKAVLSHFLYNQLYMKTEKCQFHVAKVTILGYVISTNGVSMDEWECLRGHHLATPHNSPRVSVVPEVHKFLLPVH